MSATDVHVQAPVAPPLHASVYACFSIQSQARFVLGRVLILSSCASFMFWHAAIMWLVIPPVICCIFSTYTLMMFFCGAHTIELETTRCAIVDKVTPLVVYS